MSKALYICTRKPSSVYRYLPVLRDVADALIPDNIIAAEPYINTDNDVIGVLINPSEAVMKTANNFCLGMIEQQFDRWHRPLSARPDGSFCIFRNNEDRIELLTDAVASRTIWYYCDEQLFIASSSQRAIIQLLGSFQLNKEALAWLLSTGSLGPETSWDKRIRMVPSDTTLVLDRYTWLVTENKETPCFINNKKGSKQHYDALHDAIAATMSALPFDTGKWILPLSGGFDSRALLCFLLKNEKAHQLKAVTWGVPESLQDPENDASIAKQLAGYYNIQHHFFSLKNENVTFETILHRFLIAGEGRVDAISGYMDGFSLWKQLYEGGVKGIIRGDQVFGSGRVMNDLEVRSSVGMNVCKDFPDLNFLHQLPQTIPALYKREQAESLMQWRDRLIMEYRVPVIKSALNDLKFPYVELVNPLMSKRIVNIIVGMPDSLRDDRKLYKKIVTSIGPSIPFARNVAIEQAKNIFKSAEAVAIFKHEIEQSDLPAELIKYLTANMKIASSEDRKKMSFAVKIKRVLPVWLKVRLRSAVVKPFIDPNILAFRAYLYIKMQAMLQKDATVLANKMVKEI